MKKLFTFKVNKETEVEEAQITKDAEGKEIKVLNKVKKQEPHNFFIRFPNRQLKYDAEVFFSAVTHECTKRGVASKMMLEKTYLNTGGVLSDEEQKSYDKAKNDLLEKQIEYRDLSQKPTPTEEEKKKQESLMEEITNLVIQIQSFENQLGQNIYVNTAENIASNRTALWWALMLSHEDLGNDKFKPVFGDGEYETRLKFYDSLEETEDEYLLEVVNKCFLAASLWYFNKAQTQEEFEAFFRVGEKQNLINAVEKISESNPEIKPEPVK